MSQAEYQKCIQHHSRNIFGVKNFKDQMEDSCNFCLGPKRLPVLSTPCNHIFCTGCLIQYVKFQQDDRDQKRWFRQGKGKDYECPVCRQIILHAKNLYTFKQPNWLPKNAHEKQLIVIYQEMKTGTFLDRFHPSLMNEWESFLYLFLISKRGKTLLNNFTVSLWLSEVVCTLGHEFFLSGHFAPLFRISVILFTFGNSLYLLETLGTQVFSKMRED